MELYDMLKNISGKNNEELLKQAITNVKETLNGLTEERMCKVYSSFLLKELNNQHVPARLINTLDLGLNYEHLFVLVPSNDTGYFLIDLTFSQFNKQSEKLNKLLVDGYQFIDDMSLNDYLNIIEENIFNERISVDNIFYALEESNKNRRVK